MFTYKARGETRLKLRGRNETVEKEKNINKFALPLENVRRTFILMNIQ